MKQRFTFVLLALLATLAAAPQRAGAEPAVTVNSTYYAITGTTSAELKAQMKSLGPQGYWAYTTWNVNWTGNCRVSLKISYTYPRWTNQGSAPPALRAAWNQMMTNLRTHEEGHGQHGKNAAKEIEQSHCRSDPKTITQKWAAQDKTYDAQTNHGRTQGVVLP